MLTACSRGPLIRACDGPGRRSVGEAAHALVNPHPWIEEHAPERYSTTHKESPLGNNCVGALGLTAVDVAATAPAVRLRPELPRKLHQAPDPSAVGADVRLELGGQLPDGRQVDAEQLCAPLQWGRDRPAQVRVLLSPHRDRLTNTCSGSNRECYLPRLDAIGRCPSRSRGKDARLGDSDCGPERRAPPASR
jgi:hypothetical protein